MAEQDDTQKQDAAEAAVPAPEAQSGAAGEESREHKKSRGFGRKDKSAARIEELTREKEASEQARVVMQDRLMRLQADFENFRKRTLREKSELFRTANEDLMLELLPVLDHFEMAMAAVDQAKASDAIATGVRMVRDQMTAVLGRFGLTTFEAAGQPFDPAVHEAISHLASDTVPENGVLVQTRRGYRLGDKLLRPAQVVVSRGKESEPSGAPDQSDQAFPEG